MASAARIAHDDATTVHVEWNAGGAQTPAGVPDDYGDVDWQLAVLGDGPPMIWWNFGLMPEWKNKTRERTSTKISSLILAEEPQWFLTGDNGKHETGPGRMEDLLQVDGAEVHQRLGYAAFKMASRFQARSVAQPHGALQLTKLMKAGEDMEEDPK